MDQMTSYISSVNIDRSTVHYINLPAKKNMIITLGDLLQFPHWKVYIMHIDF